MKNAEIDWSKAPEGATHFHPGNDKYTPHWYKAGYFCVIGHEDKSWIKDSSKTSATDMVPRFNTTPVWNGEGLPPVGTVCEGQNSTMVWLKGTIVYIGVDHGDTLAIMQCEHEILYGEACDFRPIRTPEQLAAEARGKAIESMRAACPYPGSACTYIDCEALYDAGYRKQDTAE